MAKLSKSKKTEYTLIQGGWRGVDRDGGNISRSRLSYSENMYRDYDGDGGGVIESIPGFRRLYSFGEKIRRIYGHKTSIDANVIIVHTESALYSFSRDYMENINNYSRRGSVLGTSSAGFSFGDTFYLLDGESIHTLDRYNNFRTLTNDDNRIYIPTTFLGGKEYEQRNLLTDKFKEEYMIEDPYVFCYSTPELIYSVSEPDKLWCEVTGIKTGYTGTVYIPKYVTIGSVSYEVRSIADRAFYENTDINEVIISSGITTIGSDAFCACTSISRMIIPDSVTAIGERAFSNCSSLSTFYLGSGVKEIDISAFDNTSALKTIHYAGTESDFYKMNDTHAFINKEILCREHYGIVHVTIPVMSEASSIISVTLDGTEYNYITEAEDGKIKSIYLELPDEWGNKGKTLIINGQFSRAASGGKRKKKSFPETLTGSRRSTFDAIRKCRVGAVFDGRVFYSGNPDLPNTVFFSERDSKGENNPFYVGAMNYFNDGMGAYPITSLLPVRDSLAVFKGGDDGSGSIFYHTPLETGDDVVPKAYPVAYVHSGVSAYGASISFLDDPVFLSPEGLSALADKNISYERNIVCRSHNVNLDLLKYDLKKASMAIWQGYLAICTREKIYLADSRATFRHETGGIEYEWFTLSGIGCHQYDARVFRYSSVAPEGYNVHERCDEKITGTVYSYAGNGRFVYYTHENGLEYAIYPTEEWEGGTFSPAVTIGAVGDLLFFGTERGELCVFNNDKRGVAPDSVSSEPNFDPDEYNEQMGNKIHPYFYSFNRHPPRYLITTRFDDCDAPHLAKDTVKGSLVIKCKSISGSKMFLEVATDKRSYREIASFTGAGLDFAHFDFSLMSFDRSEYVTIPFREHEKNWVEKQITVYSDEFASPIGLLSVSFRYTLRGKIK